MNTCFLGSVRRPAVNAQAGQTLLPFGGVHRAGSPRPEISEASEVREPSGESSPTTKATTRPAGPGFTSIAAGRAAAGKSARIRQMIAEYLQDRGDYGATGAEIEARFSNTPGSSLRGRLAELARAGLVVDSGKRRPTPTGHAAAVWCWCGDGEQTGEGSRTIRN